MLKLIFFTTNHVKLAHARHLAENYPVLIESFRRKTFYASYTEPQIDSRAELLTQSYESALEQARSAGINVVKRFFFLEDTSVRVDALSTSESEVPGVNVKYWMRDITFDVLDKLLREQSNRTVHVRSDMLLHIPRHFQRKWGVREPYIVFTGVQKGTVVDAELDFETNLIYPWLDNRSFNKWFIPMGASRPISCLPIQEASQYDFRLHAFRKMLAFFESHGVLKPTYEQRSLELYSENVGPKKTLLVCGFPCAGKTTLAQHLVRRYGYVHIEASDFMYLNYYLRHDVSSGVKIADFAEEALLQKPEIAAEKIAEYIRNLPELPVVISGFRSKKEIEWLQENLHDTRAMELCDVAFISASTQTRFQRYNKRKRDGYEVTEDQFLLQDQQQVRMGLQEIATSSEIRTIENNGSFEKFFMDSESALSLSDNLLPDQEIDFSIFSDFKRTIGLEFPIFMALLSKWEDREDRAYYTTTEIAKLINQLFPSMKPKHKDNVSRYFNQDFYAFYEIDPDPEEHKRRYRLSNTGYGRAVSVYHSLRENASKYI